MIYRCIIDAALRGVPPKKIAEDLNRKGILTVKSKFWSGVTIQRLLLDETHLGKIISNKTQGDAHRHKRPNAKEHEPIPRCDWVVVENCHQATKTQEEHDRIAELIKSRKSVAAKARHKTYAFSGLIKCVNCGHSHTFYIKRDEVFMKPCWYVDPMGIKCHNEGIKVSIIEDMILAEIRKYKDKFISKITEDEDNELNYIFDLISEHKASLQKQKQALEVVNDAYELGDYTRDEWLRRKKKWEDRIFNTKNDLYEFQKQADSTVKITNADRQNMLEYFFDNITQTADFSERNDLYRTIIESIIWTKNGNDIYMTINYK